MSLRWEIKRPALTLAVFLAVLLIALAYGCRYERPGQKVLETPIDAQESASPGQPASPGGSGSTDGSAGGSQEQGPGQHAGQGSEGNVEEDSVAQLPGLEEGSGMFDSDTAAWAHSVALNDAEAWTADARLFQIKAFNLKEGALGDTYESIGDKRIYNSYYVVSYLSEAGGNREVFDVRIDMSGITARVTRYLPGSLVRDYQIEGWELDSDDIARRMEAIKKGGGFFIKSLEISPAELLEAEGNSIPNYKDFNTNEPADRIGLISAMESSDPIGIIVSSFNVVYEMNLRTGQIIGFYEKN